MKKRRYECAPGCPVEATLDLIDGKWKGIILFHLLDGTLRFNELMRRLNAVTQRMLTKQLRELEESGLILRTVYAQVPPKVEYSLTPEGESLRPVLMALYAWGGERMARLNQTERPMPGTPGERPMPGTPGERLMPGTPGTGPAQTLAAE